jgi:acetate kinase
MGFTPLEGLVMATRCGSIDPGIIPYLQSQQGLSTAELEHVLNRESGLLGISGLSADLREIQAAADNGHERAQLANSIYIHSIQKGIGAMAASLGGLDVVVFTAGVGENSPRVRALVCKQLDFLGIELDQDLNANCSPDAEISRPSSRTKVLVLATQEEQEMFREVRELIG